MKITGAKAILKMLEKCGTEVIFGYPGATIAPVYEELSESSITHILTRGEQAAAHSASSYARVSGKVGVCMATSGPGATNLITGIATAYMDSVPIVVITGQVLTAQIGRDVFQEADITGATAPFCKHNYLVKDTEKLPKIINDAFHIASTGRPGPVLIDIPMDVQLNTFFFEYPEKVDIRGYKPCCDGDFEQINRAVNAIANSKRPLIIAGGGVVSSGATAELITLAESLNIPVATTLMGKGALPTEHPLNFGMVGSHGFVSANYGVIHADLMLFLGARAADRAINYTGKGEATIVHVDIDPAEIGKILSTQIPIVGDIKTVLIQLLEKLETHSALDEWLETLNSKRNPIPIETQDGFISARYALGLLSEMVEGNAIVTTEVGQNQIWTARNFKLSQNGKLITSGGLGTMGSGLPFSVGAKFGSPDSLVIAVEGDGSFQMSMGELATIKRWGLDIKIVLLKNNRLGMVNELQKIRNYHRFAVDLDGSPNFCTLASAYGIKSNSINSTDKLKTAFEEMLNYKGAYLLEIEVDPEEPTM